MCVSVVTAKVSLSWAKRTQVGVPFYTFKMYLLGFKIHCFPEMLTNIDLTLWSDFHYQFVVQLWPIFNFQQFWLKEFIVWTRVGWEILDLNWPWQRVSSEWPGGTRKILASGGFQWEDAVLPSPWLTTEEVIEFPPTASNLRMGGAPIEFHLHE